MSGDGPLADVLRERLARAEAALEALRRGEVDLVIGVDAPLVVRFRHLVEENERLAREWQATFDALNDAVWIMDADQRIVRCNKAAEHIVTQDATAVIGRPCWEILHGHSEISPDCPMRRLRHTLQRESREMCLSGRWYHVTLDPILDENKGLVGAVHVLHDITDHKTAHEERIRLQEQLQQAQKLESVGRLTGGVAHDFNNLLIIILGYGDMVLSKLHPQDPMRQWVKEILGAANRAAALTRQLLAFSRKQTLQPVVLNLNDVLRSLDKMLRRLIGEDIALEISLAKDLARVVVDPGQIEQVIMNLAVNARDAMPQGGTLLMETANVVLDDIYASTHPEVTPGHYVRLSVTDTGCGMSKEVLDRIFEPFFTTKERGRGTGLGLSTVYGIVKQSDGSIFVYSEPHRGTTFKIYLPATEAEAGPVTARAGQVYASDNGEHILVVEDDESLRTMMASLLSELGYKVTTAANAGEALLLVEEVGLNPDLIVTDVVMPNMSGKQLMDRLQRTRPHLKALYMSGYTDNAIVHYGILDPGTAFIQKPFTREAIGVKIREVLGKGFTEPFSGPSGTR
ncbi:hybrid sensor histidine kinase/response regulator [Desulfosoma caldarium]|uniref:histidine kinase n=1 Tax=Desulfosoma caldarium TaxID=610254 RepID=A0A3N1UL43_9BACT|nr:PAS domain-containing hybrid sensor histidine kinase/response regulator [Desulfosoma caldarium]ROQ90119.1 PAS domain S-box-containing protein [Desulfosoma caldarium]